MQLGEVYQAQKTAERDPRKPITPDEQKIIDERFGRLTHIARVVGGDSNMTVRQGKPYGGSFFNPMDGSITLDPIHILNSPEEAEFVTGHEGMHRAITRSANEFGYPMREVNRLYSQLGFGWMHNVTEDAGGNTWLGDKFSGFKPLVKQNYDQEFKKQNVALSNHEVQEVFKKLGYWPRFSHYGSEILRHWHEGKYSDKLDPEVEKALKKTQAKVNEVIAATPPPETRDEGII